MKILILFLFLIVPYLSHAYIPKLNTILTRITSNNGASNSLTLKRTVFFKEDNLRCNETWYINNADSDRKSVV